MKKLHQSFLVISNQTFKKSCVCLLFSQILELHRELRTRFHGAAPFSPFTRRVRTSSQCLNYKEARRGFDCYVNPPYLTHMSVHRTRLTWYLIDAIIAEQIAVKHLLLVID